MSRNRGWDTEPELLLRKHLWRRGFRYRLRSKLPGKPDIVFVRQKVAVFVDGCFWHGCPEHATKPKTNSGFWQEKIEKNRARDKQVNEILAESEWKVVRIWEHEIKQDLHECAEQIEELLCVHHQV